VLPNHNARLVTRGDPRGLGGSLRSGRKFPDLMQARDLDLERSRCVAVRRPGVGALRQRRIDAMEFGIGYAAGPCSSSLPLTLPALITRRSVVLFTPAAAAAAARVRFMVVRLAVGERCAQRGEAVLASPPCRLSGLELQLINEASSRTNHEQLFRFLWRVKPWSNTGTAASAGTTKLTKPYEMLAVSTKEQT
jgi:hypothetical protein